MPDVIVVSSAGSDEVVSVGLVVSDVVVSDVVVSDVVAVVPDVVVSDVVAVVPVVFEVPVVAVVPGAAVVVSSGSSPQPTIASTAKSITTTSKSDKSLFIQIESPFLELKIFLTVQDIV